MTEEAWAALVIKHARQRGLSCFFGNDFDDFPGNQLAKL